MPTSPSISFSSIRLPLVMTLGSSHCLPQCIRSGMLVIRMEDLMFMEYHHRPSRRPFAVVDVPYMPSVSRHNGDIVIADINNADVLRIQSLKLQ